VSPVAVNELVFFLEDLLDQFLMVVAEVFRVIAILFFQLFVRLNVLT
jgi:hypothetical protein